MIYEYLSYINTGTKLLQNFDLAKTKHINLYLTIQENG